MSVLREYGEDCLIEDREAGRLKIRYNTQEIPTTHTLRKHMKAYHDLMRHVLDNGIANPTVPAPARVLCSATKCVLI